MNKLFNSSLLIVFLAIIITNSSCTPKSQKQNTNSFTVFVDSLQSVYAPDKRVTLWESSITIESEKTRFELIVDKQETYKNIQQAIKSKFPEVEMHIELLPKENNEQLISGLVNNSVINLRSNPRHSAEIATQALLGSPLKILKKEGSWYLVQTPNKYLAWTDEAAIVEIDKLDLKKYKTAKKIVFAEQYGFSYSKPNDKSQVVTDLVIGCMLPVIDHKRKFYKVEYPDGRIAWVKKNQFIDFEELAYMKINEEALIKTAKRFNGVPYLWGGTSSKNLDCSGFTSLVFFMNGTILQRDASQQTKYGKEITTNYDYEKLKPGDLLFYGRKASDSLPERVTHVAIYMGDSQFIHSSGKVRINSMDSTRNNFLPDYVSIFVRATRVKGNFDDFGIQKISDNEFYKEIIN